MCQALHVRVLPFFRFYRGGEGRVCSFSCTNATVRTLSTFFKFSIIEKQRHNLISFLLIFRLRNSRMHWQNMEPTGVACFQLKD